MPDFKSCGILTRNISFAGKYDHVLACVQAHNVTMLTEQVADLSGSVSGAASSIQDLRARMQIEKLK